MLREKKVPGHVKRNLWKLIHTKLSFSQNIQAVLNSSWKRNEKHSDYPMFRPVKPHNQWFSCRYFYVFTLAIEKFYAIRMACVSCQFVYILSITATVGDFRLFVSSPQHANFPKVNDGYKVFTQETSQILCSKTNYNCLF